MYVEWLNFYLFKFDQSFRINLHFTSSIIFKNRSLKAFGKQWDRKDRITKFSSLWNDFRFFFHCVGGLSRIYDSKANRSILIAKCSSDFFLRTGAVSKPKHNIESPTLFQRSRFSWGKSRNKNWQLSKWGGVTKLGTGTKHSWEERKPKPKVLVLWGVKLCAMHTWYLSIWWVLPYPWTFR